MNIIGKLKYLNDFIYDNERYFVEYFLKSLNVEYIMKVFYSDRVVRVNFLTSTGQYITKDIPISKFINWYDDHII